MSKTVTLRLKDEVYDKVRRLAERENRSLSNFIETALLQVVEESLLVDEFEMAEIEANRELLESLRRGLEDMKEGRGRLLG